MNVLLYKRRCAGVELGLSLMIIFGAQSHVAAQVSPASPPTDAKAAVSQHLTAEQDRAQLLGLLGLKESELRPAPVPDAKSPHATNYDEAKADVYPNLPDPLLFKNGQPVKTAIDWNKRRREIREDFDREVLGRSGGSG